MNGEPCSGAVNGSDTGVHQHFVSQATISLRRQATRRGTVNRMILCFKGQNLVSCRSAYGENDLKSVVLFMGRKTPPHAQKCHPRPSAMFSGSVLPRRTPRDLTWVRSTGRTCVELKAGHWGPFRPQGLVSVSLGV